MKIFRFGKLRGVRPDEDGRPRSSAEIAARRPEEVASVFCIGFGLTNRRPRAEWSTQTTMPILGGLLC